MSNTYKAVYKCRLCGKLYDENTLTGERMATKEALLIAAGVSTSIIPNHTIHYCNDETMGIADFVGWEKEEQEEENYPSDGFPF